MKKVFLSVGLTPFVSTASDSTKTFTFQNYAGVQTSGAIKKEVLSKADKNEKDWIVTETPTAPPVGRGQNQPNLRKWPS